MKIRLRLYIYLLILIGFAIYINSLTNSFIGDDFDQIVKNTAILNPLNIWQFLSGSTFYSGGGESLTGLHYRPLMLFFYSVIYTLFGLKPIFFHLFQLILHIANSVLLFLFFRYFFKNTLAFFLALLFLIHPINNETVVYIANLQDALYLFFGLTTVLLIQTGRITNNLKSAALISFLLLLSLLSKETGILFTGIIFLQALLFKKVSLKFAPLTSLTPLILYLFSRIYLAEVLLPTQAIAPIANAPLLLRLLNLPAILFYYIKTFFFPVHLVTTQFWIVTIKDLESFWLPLFVVILTLLALLLLGKRLQNSKKTWSYFIFFLTWLVIGLLVHIQLIPLEMTVADRWFYFSFIGAAGLLGLLLETIKINKKFSKVLVFAGILVLLLLSTKSFLRNMDWKDPLTLYKHDLALDRENFFLENSLASEYLIKGEYQKAKPYVARSLKLYPYFGNLNNMAVIANSEGDRKLTKQYLEKAISIDNNAIVNENYAKYLFTYETPNKTLSFIENSLIRYPNNATLWMYRGLSENKKGDHKKALEYSKKAYDLNPNDLTKATLDGIKGIIIN